MLDRKIRGLSSSGPTVRWRGLESLPKPCSEPSLGHTQLAAGVRPPCGVLLIGQALRRSPRRPPPHRRLLPAQPAARRPRPPLRPFSPCRLQAPPLVRPSPRRRSLDSLHTLGR